MLDDLYDALGGVAGLAVLAVLPLGGLYWIWMAIHLGSFFMFFLGLAGPFALLTAPIGMYSLIFGMPDWIRSVFG